MGNNGIFYWLLVIASANVLLMRGIILGTFLTGIERFQ